MNNKEHCEKILIPVTDDGIAFLPKYRRKKGYQIGGKGEETYYLDYFKALEELKKMNTPKWRRPNKQGNWGIKNGVTEVNISMDKIRNLLKQQISNQ